MQTKIKYNPDTTSSHNMQTNIEPSPYQQLDDIIAEKIGLDEKLAKLDAFGRTSKFALLPADEQGRLSCQHSLMERYSAILSERIDAFVNKEVPVSVWMNLYIKARACLISITDLAEDYDENGATGPLKPYSWETVGRLAIDYARSELENTDSFDIYPNDKELL